MICLAGLLLSILFLKVKIVTASPYLYRLEKNACFTHMSFTNKKRTSLPHHFYEKLAWETNQTSYLVVVLQNECYDEFKLYVYWCERD